MTRRWCQAGWFALTIFLLIPAALVAQPPVQPVRLLLVFGIAPELPEVASFTKQLRLAMRSEIARPVEFYQEYLDLDRFPGRVPELSDYFDDKYRGYRIDVVVAIGAAALRFSSENLRPVLPNVPIVFALTNDVQLEAPLPRDNVTGRLAHYPFAEILDMARRLQPDAEQVAIVGGVSRWDSVAVTSAIRAVSAASHPLGLVMLRGLSYDALLDRLVGIGDGFGHLAQQPVRSPSSPASGATRAARLSCPASCTRRSPGSRRRPCTATSVLGSGRAWSVAQSWCRSARPMPPRSSSCAC